MVPTVLMDSPTVKTVMPTGTARTGDALGFQVLSSPTTRAWGRGRADVCLLEQVEFGRRRTSANDSVSRRSHGEQERAAWDCGGRCACGSSDRAVLMAAGLGLVEHMRQLRATIDARDSSHRHEISDG